MPYRAVGSATALCSAQTQMYLVTMSLILLLPNTWRTVAGLSISLSPASTRKDGLMLMTSTPSIAPAQETPLPSGILMSAEESGDSWTEAVVSEEVGSTMWLPVMM